LEEPLWKHCKGCSKKLNTELLHDPATPLLRIYSEGSKSVFQRDICILLLIAAFFIIAKIW
jgi:hypothetical protein